MKTDIQIMNELAVNSDYLRPLSDVDSKALKSLLLEMFKDISSLCEANHLEYMLAGGSCLGAVRHKGFIPWDDDLDIIMPRASYNKLIDLLAKGSLGSNYEYDAPNKQRDCKNNFLKIYRKGTFNVEIFNECAPGPKGVYIDVFPMDSAPSNRIMQRLKGFISDFLNAVCVCVLYSQYPSRRYCEFMQYSQDSLKRYKQRLLIGKIFGVISHKTWVWWFDSFNSSTKNTGYMTIPAGRNHYVGEILPKEIFLPTTKLEFEDIQANVPGNYDAYLKALYKDYMSLPPEEKRERHFVYKFSINDK